MSRRITPSTSVDNLKHEAKRWLKAIRAGDADAWERFAAVLDDPPRSPGLRDVQLALARSYGMPGWRDLTRAVLAARDMQQVTDSQSGALLMAANTGEIETVRAILDAHPHLLNHLGNLPGHTGRRTALHFAINAPHAAIVRLLLERGADPNIRDEGDNAFPLHFAAEKNDLPIIRLLIEHGADPIGSGDMHELEVIGWATVFGKGDPAVVAYLLAHGVRHNVSSAIVMGDRAALRQLIADDRERLERPMDRTNRRRHPLHLAVVKRQLGVAEALIGLGADIDARDSAGFTPLDQAALDHQQEMIDLLLAHGAAIDLPAALALGRDDDVVRLLGSEADAFGPGGRLASLIIRAAEQGSVRTIATLLAHGADPNIEDSESEAVDGTIGYTALHAAAFHGHLDAARSLLEHGAKVTTRDSAYCGSPAGWAAYAGHDDVRDLILDGRIDIIDAIEFDRVERIRALVAEDPAVLSRPLGAYLRGTPRFSEWLQPAWTPLELAEARSKPSIAALLRELARSAIPADPALVSRFLDHACPDHHVRGASDHVLSRGIAMRLLEQHPSIATASLATRIVCGDVDGVRVILASDPDSINRRDETSSSRAGPGNEGDLVKQDWGKKGWTPLLYAAFTRLPLQQSTDNAVAMMRLLLDAGADPNANFMAGDSRYTPLVGVIGEGEEDRPPHPERDALVHLLLDRGAQPYDQQVGYNIGFKGDVLWFLEAIHAHAIAIGRAADWADPEWKMINMGGYGSGARWYLTIAIDHNNETLARWCLDHGASANAAPASGRVPRRKVPLYELAVRATRFGIAELLRQHGADSPKIMLTPAEELTAAAMLHDGESIRRLLAQHDELRRDAVALETAVQANDLKAIELLLEAGVSIESENRDGERALHVAAWSNALDAAALLMARGVEVDSIRGNYHNTALGAAGHFRHTAMIDLLSRSSRDFWTLVYLGRIARLRELLAETPGLASGTRGNVTPLFWLPIDDEPTAVDVARLLLAHGADPLVRDEHGMTAADHADRIGMPTLAKLLRDTVGAQAPDRPTVEGYDAMAQRLLEAYRTGAPEAMERHYADTWHRREWSGMRSYVLADLGIQRRSETDFPDITLDDARRWIAYDHQFKSWDDLVNYLATLPPTQRSVTRTPVGAAREEPGDADRFIARDWDLVIDAIESRGYTAVHANGQMTDGVLKRIAAIPHVTSLHLGGSKQLTDRGILALAAMPQLRLLDIGGTPASDRGMTVLRELPNLVELKAGGTQITDTGAAELARCRRLTRVVLIWTRTGDGAIRALAGMPAMRHLVSGSSVTDAGLAALHDIPAYATWQDGEVSLELTSPDAEPNMLVLRGVFTDRGMSAFTGLDGLFGLSVESRGITARGLVPLESLAHLGKLSFDAHDDAMAIIGRLPHLRFLSVQDTDATDAGWTALAASRTIEGIWGRQSHGLRSQGFLALSRMPSLANLAVSCKHVDDAAVAALPAFPALRELMPMDIPDAGYRHIGRCERLEKLTLMYCRDTGDEATRHIVGLDRLRRYFASYTQITDRTPELLATMKGLEEIEFSAISGITTAGVAALARSKSLRRLQVEGSPMVTPDVAAAFPAEINIQVR